MGSMTIGAKYKTTPKDPGTSGVLRMNEDRFTFTPNDPRSAMKLNADFRSIKGHKFNKVDARVLGKHQGTVPPRPNVPPENSVASTGPEQLSAEEMERRMKLLREDSELQKLHKKFVLGNILQEYEFWATRKNLLDDEAIKAYKQRPGFKSAMLADVRPLADGRTNKVTFNLSTEIIHQVLRVKDAMTQIYQKLQNMKESAQPDVRHEISQLVKPMTQALDAAFNHDLDQQQKYS